MWSAPWPPGNYISWLDISLPEWTGDDGELRQATRLLAETIKLGLPAFTYFYTVGSVGFWLPLYVKGLDWSYTLINLLATVYFLAITPSNIISGILADVTGKPSLILAAGMTVNAIATSLMPYTVDPHTMMILRVVQGLGLATSLPLALGGLSLLHGVSRGVGITVIMQGLGMASGSLLGGALVETLGYAAMFHSSALLSLISAMLALRWSVEARPVRISILDVARRIPRYVLVVPLTLTLRNIFASGVFAVLSIIFSVRTGLSIVETAVALAINPLAQMVMGLAGPRLVRGWELYAYSLGLASTGLSFLIYLYATSPMDVYMAQLLLGAGFGLASVAGNIYIISNSPREIRYTASSLFSFAFNLGWILGTSVAGGVMDNLGMDAWMKASVPGTILSALSAVPLARLAERRGSKPDDLKRPASLID